MADDFTQKYNTQLSPEEETAFLNWATANHHIKDLFDYDMRGAWKSNVQQAANGHFPDTYKKPNHPTFSNESIYSGQDGNIGGEWQDLGGGQWMFAPSKTNLAFHSPEELKQYMAEADPNVSINFKGVSGMDDKMMQALLQSYGAPMNARNANIARNFFAANPDVAERRAMGLRGSGLDDNSDLLNGYLEKMIQADTTPSIQTTPLPAPAQAAAPAPVQARATAPSRSQSQPASVEGSPVIQPSASRQGNYGPGETTSGRMSLGDGGLTAEPGSGHLVGEDKSGFGSLSDWLLALLGGTAATAGAIRLGKAKSLPEQAVGSTDFTDVTGKSATPKPAPTAEQGLPLPKKVPAGGEMSKTNQDARTRSLQEEIDLDNRMLKAQMDQIRKRNLDQKAAEDLARAARRATGRR